MSFTSTMLDGDVLVGIKYPEEIISIMDGETTAYIDLDKEQALQLCEVIQKWFK